MEVSIDRVSAESGNILANLVELYEYDLSDIWGTELNEMARFGYEGLEAYWEDNDKHAFIVRVDGFISGFALVARYSYFRDPDAHVFAEFFVLRKYRLIGVGRDVVMQVSSLFPGRWEVPLIEANDAAKAFWLRTASYVSGEGNWKVSTPNDDLWEGDVLVFERT